MGLLRFAIPEPQRVRDEAVQRAYVSGIEGVPWRSVNSRQGGQIVIQRDVSESGNFYIAWDVADRGECVLSTASLMERSEPYHLPVELARGVLNRVRNYAAAWQSAGMDLPDTLHKDLQDAAAHFFRAVTIQDRPPEAAAAAQQAIEACFDAIDNLTDRTSQRVLQMRKQQSPQLPTLFVGPLDESSDGPPQGDAEQAFLKAFNTAVVPMTWSRLQPGAEEIAYDAVQSKIEWCKRNNLRVIGGPLLRPDRSFLPDWTHLLEDNFEQLQAHVVDHVSATVQRFRDDVHVWHCAAAMNVHGTFPLSDEQSLRLTLASIESVRAAASKTPIFISVDQPWGEFLAREDFFLSPIHFADALVRADLGLAGIGLEINLGYFPGGTEPREVLEFSQQIDRWTQLGLPLVIVLTAPSDSGDDPAAARQPAIGDIGAEQQLSFVKRCLEVLLSKPAVHAVIWGQLSDAVAPTFAHGGLFDGEGREKPLLAEMTRLRQQHLA